MERTDTLSPARWDYSPPRDLWARTFPCAREAKIHRNRWLRWNASNRAECIHCIWEETGNLCVLRYAQNGTLETLCHGWFLFTIPAIIQVIELLKYDWAKLLNLSQPRYSSPISPTGGLRMEQDSHTPPSTTRWCPRWRSRYSPALSTPRRDNTTILK